MSGSTLFTDAMALTPAGDGRYDGELNEHWTIGPKGSGPKVHGGAMLALCANAARMEHSGQEHGAHAQRRGRRTVLAGRDLRQLTCGRRIRARCG